jgi:hypothetical protein
MSLGELTHDLLFLVLSAGFFRGLKDLSQCRQLGLLIGRDRLLVHVGRRVQLGG